MMRRYAGMAILLAALLLAGCGPREEIPPYETFLPPPTETADNAPMTLTLVAELDPKAGPLRSIAVDRADRLYALGSEGVKVLDPAGKPVTEWSTPKDAWAIAAGPDGTIYVGLTARVLTVDTAGKPLGAWGTEGSDRGQLRRITSIAATADSVYVADARNLCVNRYAVNGDFITDLGKRDLADHNVGLIAPSPYLDVAVDSAGRVLVTNPGMQRVETHSPDGKLLSFWGRSGLDPDSFTGCCNPTNLAITREGWIVTSEKGTPRVKVSDAEGKLLAYLPSTLFPAGAAGMDLAVDSNNRILVADPVNGGIRIYALSAAKGAP